VRQGKGNIPNFDTTANEMLPYFPGVSSLQLAPGGVVLRSVPLAGNEGAIGHDLLKDPKRNKEAFLARDTGKLTLAGPFNLVQGGVGAVGRLPVFLDNRNGKRSFWGFTCVLIRFPEVLSPARLSGLVERGYQYELWRTHPDTGEKQIIVSSSQNPLLNPVERSLELPNGTWTLSVAPSDGWSDPTGLALKAALGLLFSLLVAGLVRSMINTNLKARQMAEALTIDLQESEAKYRALVESSSDWIWEVDENSVYTFSSPQVNDLLGYTVTEVVGKTLFDLMPSKDPALIKEQLAAIVNERKLFRLLEKSNLHKDGRIVFLETSGVPLIDSQGRFKGYRGIDRDITERKQAETDRRTNAERLEQLLMQTIGAISATVEARDPYTAGHENRVAELACTIARRMGLAEDIIHGISLAASIHDLGKIRVPAEILCKPSRLSPLELELVKEHPQTGFDIIKDIHFPMPIAQMVLQHHERQDGSGYPQGLKDGQILLEARILAVADVVEAMASHRPYRAGLGVEAALTEIKNGKGTLYDPAVVDACLIVFREDQYKL
jgi:PAS domain S-box-containing protein